MILAHKIELKPNVKHRIAFAKSCGNSCGLINDIPLSQRIYSCECGYFEDRDLNAAKNLSWVTGHCGSDFEATQSETTVAEVGISLCAHKSAHRK